MINCLVLIKDIAVGAPYDGDEDGIGGIVYIYHGHSDGLSKTPDQVNYILKSLIVFYTGMIYSFINLFKLVKVIFSLPNQFIKSLKIQKKF